jgi:hypothetical protein
MNAEMQIAAYQVKTRREPKALNALAMVSFSERD